MHFPEKPPYVAAKALPMGDKQLCLSSQGWQISSKIRAEFLNLSFAAHTRKDSSGLSSHDF